MCISQNITINDLISNIKSAFAIDIKYSNINAKSFWEFAPLHTAPEEFPKYLAQNMLISLCLSQANMISDEIRDKLSLFIMHLDMCQDDIVRDKSIEMCLKIEFILTEMRVGCKEKLLEACKICSNLTPLQISCVLCWLQLLKKNEQLQYLIPESLLECWEAALEGKIPKINDLT